MSLSFEEPEIKGELWEFSFSREVGGNNMPGKINYRMPEKKAKTSFERTHKGIKYTHRLVSAEEQKAKLNENKKSILDSIKAN